MPSFNDVFSTFDPTLVGLNPPPSYETTHGLSYITNEPVRSWFVEASYTWRWSRKSGFKIPATGFVEIEFTYPIQSSALALAIGGETWQNHVACAINTYSSSYIGYCGAESSTAWSWGLLPPDRKIKFRIERNFDDFNLTCLDSSGEILGQHTGTKINVGDDVAIGQAETGYKLHRMSGQNGYPAPAPVAVIGVTKTTASLQCAAPFGAVEYQWEYREVGSNLWLPGPTTNTNFVTLTNLRAGRNHEARVRFGA